MTRRRTTEEFITKSREIHGDKYDYSLVNYQGEDVKVSIICPEHGEFVQRAGNHIRKGGKPNKGAGCPICANKTRNKNNKKTHEQTLKEIEERNKKYPPVYFCEGEKYTTAKKKYKWVCEEDHVWESKFGDTILNGHGCPICAKGHREQTMLERYGAKHTLQSSSIREKWRQTIKRMFNVENPSKSTTIKDKKIQISLDKYGVPSYFQRHWSEETVEKVNNKEWLIEQHHINKRTIDDIAHELNISDTTLGRYFHSHNINILRFPKSNSEKQVGEYLSLFDIEIKPSDRSIIPPQELDIYIPSKKLAIELDGIRWHSELQGKDKHYHLNKTIQCEQRSVRLIHIFENEWIHKQEIVKSRLNNMLNNNKAIYARKCKIVNVVTSTERLFLNNTHIQGSRPSSIALGLTYNDELVSIMTFGKSRYNKNYQYELIRFSSKLGTSVVGGASKLFKHFIKLFTPNSVISYADKRWNTGNVYTQLGFTFSHNSEPNYYYFHITQPNILHSRVQFQKHKLSRQLEIFDPYLTEWENMQLNGYDRIWDCGNAVFVWRN